MNTEEELIEQPLAAQSITKICPMCKEELTLDHYHNDKSKKSGVSTYCKSCHKIRAKEQYEINKEDTLKQKKEYYKSNRLKISEQKKAHYNENKATICLRCNEYYRRNKDRVRVWGKEYRDANKESISEQRKEYREANKESIATKQRAYRKTPIGLALKRLSSRKSSAKRRAIKQSTIVEDVNTTELANIHTKCFWCAKPHEGTYHIDHFYPLSTGGTHTKDNLVISCPTCNMSKGAKDPYIFGESIGLSEEEINSRLKEYE